MKKKGTKCYIHQIMPSHHLVKKKYTAAIHAGHSCPMKMTAAEKLLIVIFGFVLFIKVAIVFFFFFVRYFM